MTDIFLSWQLELHHRYVWIAWESPTLCAKCHRWPTGYGGIVEVGTRSSDAHLGEEKKKETIPDLVDLVYSWNTFNRIPQTRNDTEPCDMQGIGALRFPSPCLCSNDISISPRKHFIKIKPPKARQTDLADRHKGRRCCCLRDSFHQATPNASCTSVQ